MVKSVTQAARKKKSECSQHRSQTYDLVVTSQYALPLSYRKRAVHVTNILHTVYGHLATNKSTRHQRITLK